MTANGEAACSFCGAGASSVGHLIAGPGVWICDGCVRVCHGIIESLGQQTTQAGNEQAGNEATAVLPADPVMAEIAQARQPALLGRWAARMFR